MTKQISGCLGLGLEGKAGLMKDTRNFLGGGDLLYLDGGGGWLNPQTCQNSSTSTLKMGVLHDM